MRWIAVAGAIVACGITGLLGLIAGINLNPSGTVRFVPNMGSLGDWLAATGTFAAVWVALAQSSKQAEKERPRAKVYQEFESESWSVRVLSEGIVPYTVLGAELQYDALSRSVDLSLLPYSGSLPQKLDRGSVLQLVSLTGSDFGTLAHSITEPVLAELSKNGVTSSDGDLGVNEKYFDELKLVASREARLFIRTGHGDEIHQLPNALVKDLFSLIEEKERSIRKEQIRVLKGQLAELVALMPDPRENQSSSGEPQ
ncbi:hypothetical protein [Pseudomonas syringae]|uniref:hypothetical protein n=1 Tax=Pseudomonas syringae TaxID=317 RepID=UPI000E319B80|nr:hypothetical protein [Pseudomonas syringae]MCH5519011.1 hypothetical protein [Pseudomonas syringae pv. lapsa]